MADDFWDAAEAQDWDAALARLEDVLHAAPYERALPDLATILDRAAISERFLREDDRALKVLHEAIVARPLSSLDAIEQVRTEVELLTLEVEVLADRLADPATSPADAARSTRRLADVRTTLNGLRHLL